MQRSRNRQLFLNIGSGALSYVLSLGITFFLTPYIVGKLGIDAYGFIGLSVNIINYTSLLTVALNSMAGRFISLHYHRRDYRKANIYLASVFYANLFLSVIISLGFGALTFFLDQVLDIPEYLIGDVKFLFALLLINAVIGLITNVFSVATFVKNRMEESNLRSMIGTLIRCVILILLFSLFSPKLWYFGVTAIIMTLYIYWTNRCFCKTLTPELHVNLKNFRIKRVWELIMAGVWNLISSLTVLINEGLDLLLANLFINPVAMGMLSVAKTIPNLVTSFITSLSGSFNPEYMKLYAECRMEELKQTLLKSVRLLSFLTSIPLAVIFAYGDSFFLNWLPEENWRMLYYISCVGAFLLIFALPFQSIWYVFTLDNKLKRTSINALQNSIITCAVIIAGMYLCENDVQRLFVIVGARTVLSSVRCMTFLPLYASKVMGFPRVTFYRPIITNVLMVMLLTAISSAVKFIIPLDSWLRFFSACGFTATVGLLLGIKIILTQHDRQYLYQLVAFKLGKFKHF